MDISSVQKAAEEGNHKLGSALKRKSYPDVAALYTEHAKVLAPDAPIVTGREAIERFWRETATVGGILGATLKTLDLEVAGNTAYEVGEATLILSAGQGPTVKYLVVWKRGDDDVCRIHRDIWNAMPSSG
jgi:ketosteroid isomerase-like protein